MRIISTKEARFVLGKSMRQTRRLMNKVRLHYGKDLRHPISADEFCRFFQFDIEDLSKVLQWN